MRLFPKNTFIQNLDSPILRENFFVSSVTTIVVIRVFLKLTGYPQIGISELHFAHLLWGGLFMLFSLLLFITYVSKSSQRTAVLVGGIGFGAFIDELGKFITRDNDYFFQPAIALMYAIFVLLFLTSKLLERQQASRKEYLINALEMVKEAVINELDSQEKEQALKYLSKANTSDPLVIALQQFLDKVDALPVPSQSLIIRIRHQITDYYIQLSRSEFLSKFLGIILGAQAIAIIVTTAYGPVDVFSMSFSEYGRLFSSLLALWFVICGFIAFAIKSQQWGYRLFKISILNTLLLTQFFQFYDDSITALVGISVNILLLLVVDYILEKIRAINGGHHHSVPSIANQ